LFNMSSNLPSSEGMTICPFDDSVEISFRITNFFSVFWEEKEEEHRKKLFFLFLETSLT
jgi:hypothetical protein